MGFKLAELFVAVRADTTRFTAAMVGMKGVVVGMKAQLQQLSTLARNVFFVGGALIAATMGAAAAYERSMARIRAITRMSSKEFVAFDKVVRDLGTSTIYSAKEVSDAAKFLAVSGFSVKEIMGALPTVMDLAAAGQMDVAQAADYAARTMRGMGIDASQLSGAVDMMVKAFTSANTDLREFSEALSYVGPIARFSSYSLNEVGSAIMVVSNAGIKAERAGTGLRRFLAELSRQASPTRDAFEKFGITLKNQIGQLRPLPDIIDELSKAMEDTIPEADRLGKLMDIFGLRAGPAVAAMMKTGAVQMRKFEEMMRMAGGTAAFVAKVQINTLYGSFRLLKNNIQETAITLGLILKPTIEAITALLKKFHQWIRSLTAKQKEAIAATLFLTTAITGLAFGLSKVAGVLLFIVANPLVALLVGLGSLAVGLWYVMSAGETMSEKLSSMWANVASAWNTFKEMFMPSLLAIADTLRNWAAWLVEFIPRAWQALVDQTKPILVALEEIFAYTWSIIGDDVISMAKTVKDSIVGAWRWVINRIGPIVDWYRGVILKTMAALTFAMKNWRVLVQYVMYSSAYSVVKFANKVQYFFMVVIPAYLKWFSENWRDIFQTIWDGTVAIITNLGKNIKNFFSNVWGYMKGKDWEFAWTPLMDGFKSSIKEWPKIAKREIGPLEKTLGDLVDKTGKEINKRWDKHFDDFVGRVFDEEMEEKDLMPDIIDDPVVEKELGKKAEDFGIFAGKKFAESLKNAPAFVGLEEMSRRLQRAALKKDTVQVKQLDELKKINENIKRMGKPEFNPVVG